PSGEPRCWIGDGACCPNLKPGSLNDRCQVPICMRYGSVQIAPRGASTRHIELIGASSALQVFNDSPQLSHGSLVKRPLRSAPVARRRVVRGVVRGVVRSVARSIGEGFVERGGEGAEGGVDG